MKEPHDEKCAPLPIAVIGVGAMGRAHCRRIIEQQADLTLVAVVDAHLTTALKAGAEFDVPAFGSVAEMLDAGLAEAALVATPHPLHLPAVEACLQGGLHVVCEKPLAETVSAADRMLVCARQAGRTLAVMFQRRFEPVFEAALRFVEAGELGEIRRSLLVLPDFRTQCYYEANAWRATWAGEGGGVLVNQAPHLLDRFVLLGGMPQTVHGTTATCRHDIEVEDRADARLEYANGAVGYIHASTNEPVAHEMLELVGSRGSLTYHRRKLECLTFDCDLDELIRRSDEVWARPTPRDVTPEIEPVPDNRLQGMLLRNFARHVRCGEPLRCDATSGLASLELANAVMLSSHWKTPVSLPIHREAYDAFLTEQRADSRPRKRGRLRGPVTDPRLV